MRSSDGLRIEPPARHVFELSNLGWLQAGFGSFAYRLAHLRLPRPGVMGVLVVVFLLV
ncbi:MAG: hypothetical protein ACTHKD_06970 [Devosia sp.]|jgi:hypothetical protein|nr:hypothetical protein [Devosia sp.]